MRSTLKWFDQLPADCPVVAGRFYKAARASSGTLRVVLVEAPNDGTTAWIRFPSDTSPGERSRALAGLSASPTAMPGWEAVHFNGDHAGGAAIDIFARLGYSHDFSAVDVDATTKESTTMATEPTGKAMTPPRPSTASRVLHAAKVAAVGKAVTEAEHQIVQIVKARVRAAGYNDLPDHPFYDKLILASIPVAVMEIVNRYPDRIPGADYVWEGADAALHFQACREVDALGNVLKDAIGDVVGLFSMLGSSVKNIEAQFDTDSADRERVVEFSGASSSSRREG